MRLPEVKVYNGKNVWLRAEPERMLAFKNEIEVRFNKCDWELRE